MGPLGFSLIENFDNSSSKSKSNSIKDTNHLNTNKPKKPRLKLKKKDSDRIKKIDPGVKSDTMSNSNSYYRKNEREYPNPPDNYNQKHDNSLTDEYIENITKSLTSQNANKQQSVYEVEDSEDDDIQENYFEEDNNMVEMYDNLNPPLQTNSNTYSQEYKHNDKNISSTGESLSTINEFDEDSYKSIPRNYQSNDDILYDIKQGIQGHVVNNKGNQQGQDNDLLSKLNQLIILLEEQQEQKTGHVMEELIMYCFLGVFMIYLIDSFVRVGKYSR